MDDKEDFLGGSPNNTTYVNNVGRGGRANMMGSIVRQRNSRRYAGASMVQPQQPLPLPGVQEERFDDTDIVAKKKKKTLMQSIVQRKTIALDLVDVDEASIHDDLDISKHQLKTLESNVAQEKFFPLRFAKKKHLKTVQTGDHESGGHDFATEGIKVATRKDYIKTCILALILSCFVGVCCGWKTHEESDNSVYGIVGTACVTKCLGDSEFRNFFLGKEDHFESGDVIKLSMQMDPRPHIEGVEDMARVEILRLDTDSLGAFEPTVVHTTYFGPPDNSHREKFKEKVVVDWETPENHHIINVYSESGNPISFTMYAQKQNPLSDKSVLIAALVMGGVYVFILLEVLHRTLVSIFGSMIALFFYFLIHNGETESIKVVMLHQEWSTLGLLFGMMIIIGELSHTGVFEWLAVRILERSKGSLIRLMLLLCLLTAVSSAFLDNVTTMLLIAPVTIDMCTILEVDPRPFLISEVILSNVGGTATLIGDPPNIIIGSSFKEVGFTDFIVNVMPCIFLICVPASLGFLVWIYSSYLKEDMRKLDIEKLKETYPIYDVPKLYIAGTSTAFLILLFFLHPVHHKDTAWLALICAFLCMSFTNPHDVHESLKTHVEWDSLLFFAGLFVLVEVCASLGLLEAIGGVLAELIKQQDEAKQLPFAITILLWVSSITSAFLDNIPYTTTMIPVVRILADELPETLPLKTLAWALSFGACLGGNGTLLGASANIVTAGISSNKGYDISFVNFFYPGMLVTILTVAIANLYMAVVYVWV